MIHFPHSRNSQNNDLLCFLRYFYDFSISIHFFVVVIFGYSNQHRRRQVKINLSIFASIVGRLQICILISYFSLCAVSCRSGDFQRRQWQKRRDKRTRRSIKSIMWQLFIISIFHHYLLHYFIDKFYGTLCSILKNILFFVGPNLMRRMCIDQSFRDLIRSNTTQVN